MGPASGSVVRCVRCRPEARSHHLRGRDDDQDQREAGVGVDRIRTGTESLPRIPYLVSSEHSRCVPLPERIEAKVWSEANLDG